MNKQVKSKKGSKRSLRRPKTLLQRIKDLSIGDAAETAYGAYSAVGALIGMNSEVKYVDVLSAVAVRTYGGTVTPLSLLAEGDTVNNRAGESVRAHGLEIRGQISANNTALTNTARVIVVQDAACLGATPAASDILEITGAGAPLSPWNHLGARRFNILWDSGPMYVNTNGDFIKTYEAVIPLRDHIGYNGAAGAIANQHVGGLFLLEMGDVVTNGPSMSFYSRFHFVDN